MNSNQAIELTPTRFIEHWVNGDDTIELVGFVEDIHGPRVVPPRGQQQTQVLEIIVNNNDGKRVRVSFWNHQVHNFAPFIRLNRIIKISRGKASEQRGLGGFTHNYNDVNELDIVVTDNSIIDLNLGPMIVPIRRSISVPLAQIPQHNGTIEIFGWVKVAFADVVFRGVRIGSGVVVHSQYRIRVHVRQYAPNAALTVGSAVRVRGSYRRVAGACPYFAADNMADIVIDGGVQQLSANELANSGYLTPQ